MDVRSSEELNFAAIVVYDAVSLMSPELHSFSFLYVHRDLYAGFILIFIFLFFESVRDRLDVQVEAKVKI